MIKGDVVLTAAEFGLFFEGADLEKRFVESPSEIKNSFPRRQRLKQSESVVTV
jgi:hypothetical protein